MDTNSFIDGVIIVVVGGLLLSFLLYLITPVKAAVGKIYKRLVGWGCQLVRWIRQFLFEAKTYCTRKRRLFALCDVHLGDLDALGVDISKIVPQLGDRKRIEAGMTVTVDTKDAKKINTGKFVGSISLNNFVKFSASKDISMDLVLVDKLFKIAVSRSVDNNEITVPCFVDDIHPIAERMKRLNTPKK